jgi:hypothetical protein
VDAVEHVAVVPGDVRGHGRVPEVLAQAGEHGADAQRPGGREEDAAENLHRAGRGLYRDRVEGAD